MEKDLQKEVLEKLVHHPAVADAWPTDNDRVRHRKYRHGKAGLPDICGYLKTGQFFAIELKNPETKRAVARPEQEEFLHRVRENNAIGICTNSWLIIKHILDISRPE